MPKPSTERSAVMHVDGVSIFRGIPYGGPTEGMARFLPPSMPDKWSGLYDATVNGQRCVQAPGVIFTDALIGAYFAGGRADRVELARQADSENCLNLNVLTKWIKWQASGDGVHSRRRFFRWIGFTYRL